MIREAACAEALDPIGPDDAVDPVDAVDPLDPVDTLDPVDPLGPVDAVGPTAADPAAGVAALYADAVHLPPGDTPLASPGTHTMGPALDTYVAQRIPTALIDRAVDCGGWVEVHGIHPAHVTAVLPGTELVDAGTPFPPEKVYNRVRPQWFTGPANGAGRALVVAVPPGRDYVRHYASLVAHHLGARGHWPRGLRRVVHYPVAEQRVADWTGLTTLVRPGDRVLMGYVQELVPLLAAGGATVVEEGGNEHYGTARLVFPGSGDTVCALGVRFSFWGCTSGRLAAACQAIGAREVVYAGKLGCLSNPADVYRRLFVPSGYVHLAGDDAAVLTTADAPPNGLAAAHPNLDSGVHVSVGTVLEEDVHQRAWAEAFGAATIDNEISQMALALARTARPGRRAWFSALHFATDYLHGRDERTVHNRYNLTNHRRSGAVVRKRAMLTQIAERLGSYFDRGLAWPAPARDGNR